MASGVKPPYQPIEEQIIQRSDENEKENDDVLNDTNGREEETENDIEQVEEDSEDRGADHQRFSLRRIQLILIRNNLTLYFYAWNRPLLVSQRHWAVYFDQYFVRSFGLSEIHQ